MSYAGAAPFLQVGEQPCIFDGYDGLVGERLCEQNLLRTKWPNHTPV
jgi:hypothetical protein